MTKASSALRADCSRELCLLPLAVLASVAGTIRPDPGLHPTHHLTPNTLQGGINNIIVDIELYTRPGEVCDPANENLSWARSGVSG